MIKDFTTEERKVLIAITKLIINQDNKLSDSELDQMNLISQEEGFEDYQELFKQVDKEVKVLNDISKMVNKVTWKETQEYIVSLAIAVARADGFESPEEHDIILYLCRVWNIKIEAVPEFSNQILVSQVSIIIKGSLSQQQ